MLRVIVPALPGGKMLHGKMQWSQPCWEQLLRELFFWFFFSPHSSANRALSTPAKLCQLVPVSWTAWQLFVLVKSKLDWIATV